ncbi:MAG: hypothetical protein ABIO49_04490, partial [Dokdonella sp.]
PREQPERLVVGEPFGRLSCGLSSHRLAAAFASAHEWNQASKLRDDEAGNCSNKQSANDHEHISDLGAPPSTSARIRKHSADRLLTKRHQRTLR